MKKNIKIEMIILYLLILYLLTEIKSLKEKINQNVTVINNVY